MSPDQQLAALRVRLFQVTFKARLNESPQTWKTFEELFARAIVETALMPVRRPEKIAEYLDELDTKNLSEPLSEPLSDTLSDTTNALEYA